MPDSVRERPIPIEINLPIAAKNSKQSENVERWEPALNTLLYAFHRNHGKCMPMLYSTQ